MNNIAIHHFRQTCRCCIFVLENQIIRIYIKHIHFDSSINGVTNFPTENKFDGIGPRVGMDLAYRRWQGC